MWHGLSLRQRLILSLCAPLAALLIVGVVAYIFFAQEQLQEEQQNELAIARQFAQALNAALPDSVAPERTLHDFVTSITASRPGAVFFIPPGAAEPPIADVLLGMGVPSWFATLIHREAGPAKALFPIVNQGHQVGQLLFVLDSALDLYEKWITFLVLIALAVSLAILLSAIAYWAVRAGLRPIDEMQQRLTLLQTGDYTSPLPPIDTPEFRGAGMALGDLASRLAALKEENRALLQRLVVLQDEERQDLSRELHDELGPLLFAIRADASSLLDPGTEREAAVQRLLSSAEALQQANRRILDSLRPIHLEEVGLIASLHSLPLVIASRGDPQVSMRLAPEIDGLDPLHARTVYRVVQEALTNVLRHAEARHCSVSVAMSGGCLQIEVADDGSGFEEPLSMGRGLLGMRERVRALGGSLSVGRIGERTVLNASVPV